MFTKKLTYGLRCAFSFVVILHCISNVQPHPAGPTAAPSSKTPVGFYRRTNSFGDVQNAVSLNNAPVGLYGKTHYPALPVPYRFPLFYGSPFAPFFYPPFFGLPNFGQPSRPQVPVRPQPPVRPRPPVRPTYRPPVRLPPAPSGTKKPPPGRLPPVTPTRAPPGKPGISPRLLGGLGGGLFGGGLPILGDIFG